MLAQVKTKLAKSEDGQRASTGKYGPLTLDISNDILHSLHVFGIFFVVGFIPLFDLACLGLGLLKSLEV